MNRLSNVIDSVLTLQKQINYGVNDEKKHVAVVFRVPVRVFKFIADVLCFKVLVFFFFCCIFLNGLFLGLCDRNREVEGDQIVISGVLGMLNSFTVAATQAPSSQVRKAFFFYSDACRYEIR